MPAARRSTKSAWALKERFSISSRRFPDRPVLGVGALIFQGAGPAAQILLVERAREPLKGFWSLPGGGVETGELLTSAIRREVLEETSLEVEVLTLFEIFERITPNAEGQTEYHFVLMDYICRPVAGTLRAADDAQRAAWFTRGEIASLLITDGAPAVIERGFEWWNTQNSAQLR